jgi:hypothetical protein
VGARRRQPATPAPVEPPDWFLAGSPQLSDWMTPEEIATPPPPDWTRSDWLMVTAGRRWLDACHAWEREHNVTPEQLEVMRRERGFGPAADRNGRR